MWNMIRPLARFAAAVLLAASAAGANSPAPRPAPTGFALHEGDRVVFLGDTLVEREQFHGWIETMLTSRFPDRQITFLNLGWSGDTPAGVSRVGLSRFQATKAPPDEGWTQLTRQLDEAAPTVLFAGYGFAASFEGEAGLAGFGRDYDRLLRHVAERFPRCRTFLLGPVPADEFAGASRARTLQRYDDAIQQLARARGLPYLPLVGLRPAEAAAARGWFENGGIHLTAAGYRRAAEILEEDLIGPAGPWRSSLGTDALRRAIVEKNEWYFHRTRPANVAYLYGFRKHEQGNNLAELSRFDALREQAERRIAALRHLPAPPPRPTVAPRAELPGPVPQPQPELVVAAGLEATVWAESPLLSKPIQINFDPQGRLWVATSQIYPQVEPGSSLRDRIVVLEDSTGAGRADRSTVFADDLVIPTGVLPGDGGVYVAQGTDLLHYRDRDGDGRADERRIVLSGFGTEDTHHNLHGLAWAPDGSMSLIQSNNIRTHVETPWGVVRHEAGGIFSFRPDEVRLQLVYRGWINAWGHQFDVHGRSFVTDGAGNEGIHWAITGATYRTVAPARRVMGSVSPGAYPKFCGLEIVRTALFPADWQGDLVTCDFRAHRVVRFGLADEGAGFVTREKPDVLRSTSSSFRPIDAKIGPDGALYVADWSNPIIQHGEVDFRDPRRDKQSGRIWRIAPKAGMPAPAPAYATLPVDGLLALTRSPDAFVAASARRTLLEQHRTALARSFAAWAETQSDRSGLLAATFLGAALRQAPPGLVERLRQTDDADVKAAAIRWLGFAFPTDTLERLAADPHPRVRLEAVRALGNLCTASAAQAALSALHQPMDRFLDYALWLTLNECAPEWTRTVLAGELPLPPEPQLVFALRAVEPALAAPLLQRALEQLPPGEIGEGPWLELLGTLGSPAELTALYRDVVRGAFPEAAAVRALAALGLAARDRKVFPDHPPESLGTLLSAAPAVRRAALHLARQWTPDRHLDQLARLAADPSLSKDDLPLVLGAILTATDPRVLPLLRDLAAATPRPDARAEVLLALGQVDFATAAPQVVRLLAAHSREIAAERVWGRLLGIAGADEALPAILRDSALPAPVAREGLRVAREKSADRALIVELSRLAGITDAYEKMTAAERDAFVRDVVRAGDPVRGERIYRRPELACVACHVIGGIGGKVGPDLTSIGASAQPDYLLEALVEPGARIKEGYLSVQIVTTDRRIVVGTLAHETAAALTLLVAGEGPVTIPRPTIAQRLDAGSSMPAGLVANLPPDELRDLVKFLSALGRTARFDASRRGVARQWHLYLVTSQNQPLGVEHVVRGELSRGDWHAAAALTNGDLVAEQMREPYPALQGRLDNPRGFYVATHFTAAAAANVTFTLEGHAQVADAWLNGAVVPFGPALTLAIRAGENALVLRLPENALPARLRLESSDVTFTPGSSPSPP
jgi:putative heme-binding domain-containing protein